MAPIGHLAHHGSTLSAHPREEKAVSGRGLVREVNVAVDRLTAKLPTTPVTDRLEGHVEGMGGCSTATMKGMMRLVRSRPLH